MTERTRNLQSFGVCVLGVGLFAFNAYLTVLTFDHDHHHNDFTYYYAAARIGLHQGWGRIYDLGLQDTELGIVAPGLGVAFQSRFINPPPLAWLAAAFTPLPYDLAYWTWVGLCLACVLLAWVAAASGNARVRLPLLLLPLGAVPVGFALQLGQPSLLVAGGVAVAAWLLRRDREMAAGLVLSLAALKPQLAWLVPPALLVAGRWRAVAAWAAASGVLLGLAFASLGLAGIKQYLELVRYAESLPVNQHLVASYVFGPGLPARGLEVALAVATLLAVRLRRWEGSDTVVAIGLLGSAAAAPYLHMADMMMLVLAGWLYLRRPRPAAIWVILAAGLVSVEMAYWLSPIPFFLLEAGCLVALLMPAHPLSPSIPGPGELRRGGVRSPLPTGADAGWQES